MTTLKSKAELLGNILECCQKIFIQLMEVKEVSENLRDNENLNIQEKNSIIESSLILIHTYMKLIFINCSCLTKLNDKR